MFTEQFLKKSCASNDWALLLFKEKVEKVAAVAAPAADDANNDDDDDDDDDDGVVLFCRDVAVEACEVVFVAVAVLEIVGRCCGGGRVSVGAEELCVLEIVCDSCFCCCNVREL